MSQLIEDLQALRVLQADPDQIVKDRYHVFEDAAGTPVYRAGDGHAIPEQAARGCLLGNIARIGGDFTERYHCLRQAVGDLEALIAFMDHRDNDVLAAIDRAIEEAS